MGLELKTAPSVEPISLTEAKNHLRVDISNDDTLISALITAAREHTETYLQKCLISQTWYQYHDFGFPCTIELLKNPVQSVTAITYIDGNGTEQTVATSIYDLDVNRKPATIFRAYSQIWPITRLIQNAVKIEFITGYGDASTNVPAAIRSAMFLLIGHLYENREASTPLKITHLPMGYEALLAPYRLVRW